MKEREYFTFCRSFRDALADMQPESQARLFMAICGFSLDGVEPTLSGVESTIWKLIRPNLEASRKKFENGCKGAEYGRKGGNPNFARGMPNPYYTNADNPTDNPTDNHNKEKELDKEKEWNKELTKDKEVVCVSDSSATQPTTKQKQNKFVPPLLQEVKDFICEKSLQVDGESFYSFYAANGWHVGRNPMKSWQMALQYWARKDSNKSTERQTRKQSPPISHAHDDINEKVYEPY